MKPWNRKINRISRTYFWTAWFLCNVIVAALWTFIVLSPRQHKVIYVTETAAGEIIEQVRTVDYTVIWYGLVIGLPLLALCYLVPLVIKRFHDTGYGTGYAILCIALIPLVIGNYMVFHVAMMPSDDDNIWGINEEKHRFEKRRDIYAP